MREVRINLGGERTSLPSIAGVYRQAAARRLLAGVSASDVISGDCLGGLSVFGADVLLDEDNRLAGRHIEVVEEAPGAAADRLAAHAYLSLGFGP